MNDPDILDLERHLCQTSLKYLCVEKLGFKDWDVCHDEMDTWYCHNRDKFFKIILIPRYHLKTSILTIGRTIQDVLNEPDTKILLASAVWDNARSFLAEIKKYLELGELPMLFGSFQSDKWNQDEIVIRQRRRPDKSPTVDTAGIEKTLTSQHYDIIRADDLVTRETCTTKEQMSKVKKFHNDLLKLVSPKNGRIDLIGTAWHYNDLYQELLEENKLRVERGEPEKYTTYIRKATRDGSFDTPVIFPKMWNISKLKDVRFSIGSYEYDCNFNNTPVSDSTQLFKKPFRYWDTLGDNPVHAITVDLAASDITSDFVVITDCAMTQSNQLCVVEYARGHFDVSQTMEEIFKMAQKHLMHQKVRKVGVEAVAYQKVFVKMLEEEMRKRNIFFEVIPIRQNKNKVMRILDKEGLLPRYQSGNLLLKRGMVELEDELEKFPVGKHDDILDTIEMMRHVLDARHLKQDKVYVPKQYQGRVR